MQRGELALHYQNFAIMPLVGIAELAARQGLNLYACRVNGRSLADAVDFLLRALDDPSVLSAHQTEAQNEIAEADFAWMEWWQHRFKEPRIARRLDKPLFHPRLGGALTLYAANTA
jgi:hypothetical protein